MVFNNVNKPDSKKNEIHRQINHILQIKDGKVIGIFDNFTESSKQFGNKYGYKEISKCCNGKKKHYMGYEWRFGDSTL